MGVGKPPFCCHNILIHTKTHERPQLAEAFQERPEGSRSEQGADESPQTGSTCPEGKAPCDSLGTGTSPLGKPLHTCYTKHIQRKPPWLATLKFSSKALMFPVFV